MMPEEGIVRGFTPCFGVSLSKSYDGQKAESLRWERVWNLKDLKVHLGYVLTVICKGNATC